MKSEKKQTEIVSVTPAFAAALLEKNYANRPISPKRVEFYADQMKEGKWTLSNTSIAIGEADGSLYDGQHRLAAVVKSGVTVPMIFSWHRDEDRRHFNRGKPDGVGGAMSRIYGEANATIKAAIISRMDILAAPKPTSFAAQDIDRCMEVLRNRRPAIEWAIDCSMAEKRCRPAFVAGAAAYTWFAGRGKAIEFFEQVCSGEGLTRSMPAYVFRKLLFENAAMDPRAKKTGGVNGVDISTRFLSAAYAHFKGNSYSGKAVPKVSEEANSFFRKNYLAWRP